MGTAFLMPSMAIELLASGLHERHDLSSVLLVGSSAAALPSAVALGLGKAFPSATVVNYHTSTEAVPAQTTMIVDMARPASLGRPTDGRDLAILFPGGAPAAPGEVWLRSLAPPRSYYGDAGEQGAGETPPAAHRPSPRLSRGTRPSVASTAYLRTKGIL